MNRPGGEVADRPGRARRLLARLADDPLLRHRDFTRLWAGQSISQLGSQVTAVALPLIAIQTLHAGAADMGVIGALGRVPFVLYLFAGVVVDRTRRRPVLIGTDLARAALVAFLCVAALTGLLSVWLICVILVVSMSLSVWFDIGYMSYLPGLVGRSDLMAGNVKLETTRATAQVAGPSLGGVLVQLAGAPLAVLVDAASFVVSAVFVTRIRHVEPPVAPPPGRGVRGIAADLAAGLRFVFAHRILRPLAVAIAVSNLAWAAELSLYLLYLARGMHLSAALIGVTLAGQGPGTLVGSLLAGRIGRRFGLSGAVIGGLSLFAVAALAVPAAPASAALAVPVLVVSGFLMALGGQVCAVNVLTTRQLLAPADLLGRVNASFRFLGLGISPLGALAGGYLGGFVGLRPALYVSVLGMAVAPVIALASPIRRIGGAETLAPQDDPAQPVGGAQ